MKLSQKKREWLFGYLFTGIWIIGFIIFTLIPICQSFFYSLTDAKVTRFGIENKSIIGFMTYRKAIISDVSFVESMITYFKSMLITLVAVIVFSVIIAVILNKKFFLRGFWRTVYFLPVIISSGPVLKRLTNEGATSILMSGESTGLIGSLQSSLPEFFTTIINTVFGRIVVILWFTGVPVLIFLAGLQKINVNIFEAAKVDGASKWEMFWKITLPSLKPLININVIYTVVSLSTFSNNAVLGYINSKNINDKYGYCNTLTWIYFLVTIIVLAIILLILNIGGLKRRKIKEVKMYRDVPKTVEVTE